MNIEVQLVDAIVRVDRRLPDVRDTLVEALFIIRRSHWVEAPQRRPHGRA